MPKYQIEVPGQGTFEVDSPSDLSDAQAYQAVLGQINATPVTKPDTGFTGAFKAGKEQLMADFERLKGKTGFKDIDEAEAAAQEREAKARQVFKPTEESFTEAPWTKFKELAGGSLPYMAAPVAAGAAALALPETVAAAPILGGIATAGEALGMGATGLASATQFTGSNLSRQVQEGKTLDQTSLLEAGAAAIPQAALDTFGLRMIPGIRGILGKAGIEITEDQAAKLAQRSLLEKAGSVALTTGKTMGTEGLTEAGQQVFERLQAGLSITDPEARKEYYDSFIGGAVLGGALGTAGQAFESKKVVPNAPAPAPEAPPPAGQQSFNVEGLQPAAGPQIQTPAQADPQKVAELRTQHEQIQREIDRLRIEHEEADTPKEKQAILVQAQKLDYAQRELEGQLEGAPARPTAPEEQMALDFEQPYPKSRLAEAPPIIGQQAPAPAPQANLDLEFAKQRLAAGAPLTPAQELMVRQDQAAQRTAFQAAPAPQLEIPNIIGGAGVPSSYKVTDSVIDTFGVTKGATKFKNAVRGLDLMNPEDAKKFDNLVEQHERKNAKIDMNAVEAFRAEKPEAIVAREVPERVGLPAVPYNARKAFQQAREAQFAFGQTAAPLSPKDVRAQKKAEYDERTGTGAVSGPTERSVPLPSAGVQTPTRTAALTPAGVGSTVGTTERPDGGATPSGEMGNAALSQLAQQVAPATKEDIKEPKLRKAPAKLAPKEESVDEILARLGVDTSKVDLTPEELLGTPEAPQATQAAAPNAQRATIAQLNARSNAAPAENIAMGSITGTKLQQNKEFAKRMGYVASVGGHRLKGAVNNKMMDAAKAGDIKGVLNALSKSKSPIYRQLASLAKNIKGLKVAVDSTKVEKAFSKLKNGIDSAKITIANIDALREAKRRVDAGENLQDVANSVIQFPKGLTPDVKRDQTLATTLWTNKALFSTTEFYKYVAEEEKALEGYEESNRYAAGSPTEVEAIPGMYDPETNTIYLDDYFGKHEDVLAHELTHAISHDFVSSPRAKNTPTYKALDKLYQHVKEQFSDKEAYGLSSLDEFVSEGLSNPLFQKELAQIKYENTTIWNKFVESIAKILGLRPDNALTELLNLTTTAAEQGQSDVRTGGAAFNVAPNELKQWFGDSKVANPDGSPMVVYTGTSKDKIFNKFNVPKNGVWFSTDPAAASQYAVENDSQGYTYEGRDLVPKNTASRVIPAYLKISNPFKMTNEFFQEHLNKEGSYKRQQGILFDKLRSQGYDGVDMGGGIWVVLNKPDQIKSTFNKNPLTSGPKFSLTPTRQWLTKQEHVDSINESISNGVKAVRDAGTRSDFWERFRIAAVDPASALGRMLSSLPLFSDGQLRADMLHHQYAQVNNLINNGLASGVPVLNKDGSVTIQDTDNNLAQSAMLAKALDNNPYIQATGKDGMNVVAEVARILRGKEIAQEDSARRVVAVSMMQEAEKREKQARQKGTTGKEAIRLHEEAKALRAKYKDDVNLNRELQVKDSDLAWANETLKNVPELQQILDIWKSVNESLIKLREDAGLISSELAADLRKNVSYVPLFAAEEDLEAMRDPNIAISGTGAKSVAQMHKLKGTDKLTRNIWENLYKQYAITTAAAFQNQVRKVGINQLASLGGARVTENSNDPDINVRYRDANNELADSNGIVNAIVDNPNALAAFQMMHYELTPLMKGLAASTKVLRAGALINPMYWIKQLIRDPLHASVVGSYVVTPADSIKEYISILKGTSAEANILARHGAFGAVDTTVDLQTFLKNIGKEKSSPTTVDKMLHKVMQMHEASDAATRVAIYKKAFADAISQGMDKGAAESFAVMKARESANFSVHGNSKTLNSIRQMIPFFSAAITSLDTVYRAATGHNLSPAEKAEAIRTFRTNAAMMAVMTIAYAMMLQGDEDYQKLPDDVKDGNWLLPNPLGEGHSFIRIPVPFEVGFLFKTIPEATVRYLVGNSTGKEVIASYGSGLLQNLPGNGLLIPQAAKPILETMTNHSFFTGRSIESMGDQNVRVGLRGQNASETAKLLSNLGLDKISLSPAKIDNIISGYTAQLGSYATSAADVALNAAEGKSVTAKNIEEMPGFKAFMTNPNISKAAGDFYKLQHEAVEAVTEYNRLKKSGDREGLTSFLEDERNKKLVMSEPALRKIQTQMSTIQNQVKLIKNNEKLDPEVRRERVNKLMGMYDQISKQMSRVLAATKLER